jgi:hypothetical protein
MFPERVIMHIDIFEFIKLIKIKIQVYNTVYRVM